MADTWDIIEEFCENAPAWKIGVNTKYEDHVEDFLQKVPLTDLFAGLEKARIEKHEDALEKLIMAIKHVFDSKVVQKQVTTSEFYPFLESGISHSVAEIRRLTVTTLKKSGLSKVSKDAQLQLLNSLIKGLCDMDTAVALTISDMLIAYSTNRKTTKNVVTQIDLLVKNLQDDPSTQASTSILRAFHIIAILASKSEENLTLCEHIGILESLLELVGGDDVLMQLNIISLIPLIAVTDAGFNLLVDSSVTEKLSSMAGMENKDAEPLLGDYALRAMSQLCARALSSTLTKSSSVAMTTKFLNIAEKRMEACLETENPTEANTLMLALGYFTGTQPPASIKALIGRRNLLTKWMDLAQIQGEQFFLGGLESMVKALRGGCLFLPEEKYQGADELDRMEAMALRQFFATRTNDERTAAAELSKELAVAYSNAYERRFGKGSKDIMDILFSTAELPADDYRCAAFGLLRVIAGQDAEWGIQAIFAHPKATSLLFNRSIEMSKTTMEWRFAVVEAVYQNPRKGVLGDTVVEKIHKFLKQGPFKGPPKPSAQVLMETG